MMTRVKAPGLPSSPAVMFDCDKRQAKVSLRHPTWCSIELALYTTELLAWIVRVGIAVAIWHASRHEEIGPRLVLAFVTVVALFPLVAALVRLTCREFLARQIFPTRTTLWVSPKAVAFRSRLYSKPVVIWRQWEDAEVGIRFIVNDDPTAKGGRPEFGSKRKLPSDHFDESAMLCLVLTTVRTDSAGELGSHDASMRTIPITQIDSDMATKVTMAYAHALTLTVLTEGQEFSSSDIGIDIDAT